MEVGYGAGRSDQEWPGKWVRRRVANRLTVHWLVSVTRS